MNCAGCDGPFPPGAKSYREAALAEYDLAADGIAQVRAAEAETFASGLEEMLSFRAMLLGQMFGLAGRPNEGRAVLAQTLDFVARTGEAFCEAELNRLAGELILQRSAPEGADAGEAEAEACLIILVDLELDLADLSVCEGHLRRNPEVEPLVHQVAKHAHGWRFGQFAAQDRSMSQ